MKSRLFVFGALLFMAMYLTSCVVVTPGYRGGYAYYHGGYYGHGGYGCHRGYGYYR